MTEILKIKFFSFFEILDVFFIIPGSARRSEILDLCLFVCPWGINRVFRGEDGGAMHCRVCLTGGGKYD